MKKIEMIFKGMLLYMTILVTMIFMMGVDSIYDQGYFFYGIMLVAALVFVCYKTINKEELEVLTLCKYLNDSDEELK
jgi:hypothetical protein